jgi:serine/threonine protein kinase
MGGTGDFIGRRVGRFTITSHLASGGMAELFIARQEAVGGFEKDLVLKMLQERYAGNARVVEMFLDEARLAAKLNHQNIVHVYDVDESEGIRYIAMEYIHGETVTDIVRRSIARGTFLPLEHAIHIIAETAAGLAYAHERLDPEGRPARIVHRDISPSNILVTYEGLTKIVDFGIARVQDQIREESGMRPGKVSYMSPEQVRGEGADHRSDIFSLGILLYEITVGRRLWRGPPEVVMRRIVEELIPPPTYVRRDYPPALELIVMKALERRPSDRHQSAAELQHELNEFMEEAGLKSGSRRLSEYMKDLFAPDPADAAEAVGTDSGRRFAEVPGGSGPNDRESEELDFDRRAPLMMRVEARSDEPGVARRGLAPVPPLEPSPGASPGHSGRSGRSGRSDDRRQDRDDPFPAVQGSAMGRARGPGARAVPGIGSLPGAGHPVPGRSVPVDTEMNSTNPQPDLGVPRVALASSAGPNVLRWVLLLVLAGAVVVVFLATR